MGKEFVLWFVLFVLLFALGVIFIWGNCTSCFFFFSLMINGHMPLIEIFLLSSFTYFFFT